MSQPITLRAQQPVLQQQMQVLPSKVYHGIDFNALRTVVAPLYTDNQVLKRFPYGTNASSLFKRELTFTINNKFTDILGNNAAFYSKMAFILTPFGCTATCIPLDDSFNITCVGTPSGAITVQ